jgi:cellulose synthase/poly-beta-1,6-N-acetylglucosamine synthase-like glycosyltransferase
MIVRDSLTKKQPFISVITAVYNEPSGIKTTLESMLAQDYPSDRCEIIVVDNNSSDNTREVVQEFSRKYPKRVRLLVEKNVQSSYAARNLGISSSKGEILAFIDADMWADRDWLSVVSTKFEDEDVGYVGCNIRIHTDRGSLVGLYNKFTGFPVETYMKESHFAGAGCIAVRKSVFKKVGLFDAGLISSGDREFGERVWRSGVKQVLVERFMLHHPARESLKSTLKKDFRIGRGNFQLAQSHPERFSSLRRNFSNIEFFLPPNPIKFFGKKIRANKALSHNLTFREGTVFYLISVLGKITGNLGYFNEYLKWKKR